MEQQLYTTKKSPNKSFFVFLRNQNKFYLNSLNLIDKKATILIRINATIISVFIIFSQYFSGMPHGKLFSSILIFSSFLSMMFAIFSSRPSTIESRKKYEKEILPQYKKLSEKIFAVGFTPNNSLEAYEKAYDELLNNQELQIGNQVRTFFLLENSIHKSYKQLRIAYEIFITGFVVVVCVFIVKELADYF